ncbi:MAG: universal stress protein [Hyphomonadaceae bacterium]
MPYRDILAIVSSVESDGHVLDVAGALARRTDGFVTGLAVEWIPALPTVVEGWVVDARWGEMVAEARVRLEEHRVELEKALANVIDRSAAYSMLVEPGAARGAMAVYARRAGITVTARPDKGLLNDQRVAAVESMLFESGRPVLIAPPGWKGATLGDRPFVCWDSGREAARALGDAIPLFGKHGQVVVATVDAKPSIEGHGDMPGVDISSHLARAGQTVELRNIDSAGRDEAEAVLDEARAAGADLIVMGGYGRSRFSEFVFGGMTRNMLAKSEIPILMSH